MNLIRLTRSYSKVFCLIFLILCVIFLYKLIKGPSSVNEERHDVGLNLEQDELQDGGKLRTLKVSLDDGTLKERIELARDYLLAQIKSNGQFVYKVNMKLSVPIRPDYNLLRHAGTIYSLAVISQEFPSPQLNEAIVTTGRWVKNQAGVLDGDHPDIMALWSTKPETDETTPEAKLGGAGLGLVALISASEVDSAFISNSELEKVANFIEFMQKPSGEFDSKWKMNLGVAHFTSLYYPGEACLGLMRLHEKTQNSKWFEVALKGLKFLASSRDSQKISHVLPDHWALISTREVLKAPLLLKNDRDILIRHAQKVATHLIREQIKSSDNLSIQWSFDSYGGLAPACTRLEGLIAVMGSLPPDEQPINLKKTVENGLSFVLANQELSGTFKGGFRRQMKPDRQGRDTEIRIDYVQHCVTALVKYYQLIKNTAGARDE